MFRIKRLYTFLLQSFLPVFLMTFAICLFIILMQFLWKYVDELVGKGLGVEVIIELFVYAALTFVPMALPLAVLLASLMTFGNLGERLELLAMKSSGISLFQIMRPIIVVMVIVSLGAFYFQNVISPLAQVKLYSLLQSVRQKSPELDIPVGSFYDQINGLNLYVNSKNLKTGMMYDMMIYDFTEGFDNANVMVADSGNIKMGDNKMSLLLTLYSGESFQNLQKQRANANIPYQRQSFSRKEFLIDFDANFNRMDEGVLSNQYIAKDLWALGETVDSVGRELDSIHLINVAQTIRVTRMPYVRYVNPNSNKGDDEVKDPEEVITVDIDSLYARVRPDRWESIFATAQNKCETQKRDFDFKNATIETKKLIIRRHELEWHKKFTLSFACMIFFFIGAPLGAIIRKGGIGMPAVISVFLFICYFFIDNSGYNMAREQVLSPMQGMWMSSVILLPLGIFFTYKAVNDSVIMNADTYLLFFKNLTVRPVRRIEVDSYSSIPKSTKEEMIEAVTLLHKLCDVQLNKSGKNVLQFYRSFWLDENGELDQLNQQLEVYVIEPLKISADKLTVLKLADFPILQLERCLHPFTNEPMWVKKTLCYLFPVGMLFFFFSWWGFYILRSDLIKTRAVSLEVLKMLKPE